MPRTTPVSDIMTTNVHTLELGSTLSTVRQLLTSEHCHHVPIVDGGRLVGMVTSTDLIRLLSKSAPSAAVEIGTLLDREGSIADIMSSDPVTVRPDDSVERAIDLIASGERHSVLVVDEQDRLVGIVTDSDLLDFLD